MACNSVFSMKLAIVICYYGKKEMTLRCIDSVREAASSYEYKIFLVNDRGPGEPLFSSEIMPDILHITNLKNLGYLKSCNKAFEQIDSQYDYIYLLNNDCELRKDSIKALVNTFKAREKVGAVGSKLLNPDGTLQEAGGIYWSNGSGHNVGRNNLNPGASRFNYIREVDKCSAASLLVKASLLRDLGGYDERYVPAYKEDADLCFEIRRLGYKVLYQPLSEVIHLEGESCGINLNHGIKKYQLINQPKFVDKWSKQLVDHNKSSSDQIQIFKSEFRPLNSPVALFIDDRVPEHNTNAGALGTYLYLKLFADLGYRVIFYPDNHKKLEPYTTELTQYGIEVKHSENSKEFKEWIIKYGSCIEIAWLSRPDESSKYIDTIKNYTKAKILYCGRDLHFKRNQRKLRVEGFNEQLHQRVKHLKRLEKDLMCKAESSTGST